MSVYEDIIAGLIEAIDDARSERKTLKRHTVELDDEDTEYIILPSDFIPCRTEVMWFDARDKVSSVAFELNPQHEETAGGGVLSCAA